jgi:predicted RNase H-like HicB family nuclease
MCSQCSQTFTKCYNVAQSSDEVPHQDEDGAWIVECPAIPGCVSQGRSREEAMANIKEAISLCLEVRAERGMPLTFETSDVEVAV